MIYLSSRELLHIAERTLGEDFTVRDAGLLDSAAARPQATVFGADAYPSLDTKAAALIHSLARNHALVDGNKRLTLSALISFLGLNGYRLTMSNDEAYEFIMTLSSDEIADVDAIAGTIRGSITPW